MEVLEEDRVPELYISKEDAPETPTEVHKTRKMVGPKRPVGRPKKTTVLVEPDAAPPAATPPELVPPAEEKSLPDAEPDLPIPETCNGCAFRDAALMAATTKLRAESQLVQEMRDAAPYLAVASFAAGALVCYLATWLFMPRLKVVPARELEVLFSAATL